MTSPHEPPAAPGGDQEPADIAHAFAAPTRRLAPPPGQFHAVRRRAVARRRRRLLAVSTATVACLAGAGLTAAVLVPDGGSGGDRALAAERPSGSTLPGQSTGPTSPSQAPGTTHPDGGRDTPPLCESERLDPAVAATEGAAGSTYLTLTLTNVGDATCAMTGYPGVSLVAGDAGDQLGSPAERDPSAGDPVRVELAPGAAATAELRVTQAMNHPADECGPVAARGLRIYPPDQRSALFVAHEGLTGCTAADVGLLTVSAVRPADTG
ncbi:DUF4232 domain-containing protein [Streptomyces mayteni]